ncbi:membrane protein [Methylobacterium sp. WSM2598]|uniref:membrane protein n=1 Tax=Methylobacterium sp. WSM2598 TaxID=398261 RepID=UPI00035C3522|nr:membrane protein [Methylobacterium sp. WSM2598]
MLSLSVSPLVPTALLWGLAAAVGLLGLVAFVARGPVALLRVLVLGLLLAALANPSLVQEDREPVKDVAAVVIDRSGSQMLGGRPAMTEQVRAELQRRFGGLAEIEPRFIEVPEVGTDEGTKLFTALSNALADVPPDRLAGIVMVTDGVVHDIPASAAALGVKAPLHVLVTGHPDERDRQIRLIEAPRFGIVGREQTIRAEVMERGGTGSATVTVRRDGQEVVRQTVRTDRPFSLTLRIEHGGPNVVEIEAEALPGELTTANNRAVLPIEGIREKLRVLLVSGEPHAGERTWRNLLKSDANVDLVHFTILRPPEKQDGTPISELSLIAFPTRELFQQKIKDFDLIIFDRYANQSVLPSSYFDNIVRYVREGGALLIAAGPEFASAASLARTRLAAILPGEPNGRVVERPYKAALTGSGQRHPVTRDLPGSEASPPAWGDWLRLIGAEMRPGITAILAGAESMPLLALSREEKGRVALLLSDHAWLWARGYQEGGPHLDLLRRLGHWLMKEPALEEEALRAATTGHGREVRVERQTMADSAEPVTVTAPSGATRTLTLDPDRPGLFAATFEAGELGLHTLRSDSLVSFVSVGPANPRELVDVFSDTERLRPLAEATGGSVRRLAEAGGGVVVPRLQIARSGRLAGAEWIGFRPSDSAVVRGVSVYPLALGLVALALLAAAVLAMWLVEGRRGRA